MNSLLLSTLGKVLLPAAAVGLILFASRRRGISWSKDLGFRMPGARMLAVWLAYWISWICVSELLIRYFHLEQARAWPHYPALIMVLRICAIGLVGPLAEELALRGMFFHLLRRTAIGPLGAIALLALAWSAMHYQYQAGTLVLVFVDGVILGLARYMGGSLWLPVIMHAVGNLTSIGQSIVAGS